MNQSAVFAQHFARMVWIAAREDAAAGGDAADDLDYAARAAELLLRGDGATISSREWRLAVNDELMPQALTSAPDLTLAARLLGHSIAQIRFESFTPRHELVAAARLLAEDPEAGDRGRRISSRFQPLGLSRVSIMVSGNASPAASVASVAEMEAIRRRYARVSPASGVASVTPAGAGRPVTPVPERPAQPPKLAEIDSDFFAVLDSAAKNQNVSRVLDDLLKQAEIAAATEDTQKVFEISYAVVAREQSAHTGESRTAYVVGVKRLLKRPILRALARHLAGHREVEEQILAVFTRLGDEAAELLVDEMSESEQRFERRAMFDILSKLKSGRLALLHAIRDHRWYVVRNAAELLGQMHEESAAPELVRLLEHKDERVRRSAVMALSQLSAQSATEPLVRAAGDPSSAVRAAAAVALGQRRSARSLDVLLERVDREDDELVQTALMEALGKNGTPSAVKKLVEVAESTGRLFKRKSSGYRSAATAALRTVDSPLARTALERLRQDRDPSVRQAAGGAG